MSVRQVVAIGASAGGIDALGHLLESLPEDFQPPVFVVQHLSPDSPGRLPEMLAARSRLPVMAPLDPLRVLPHTVYVASPDRHLVVDDETVRSTQGPHENLARPSIDVLFRSVARSFGTRATGVVLTGKLGDGAAGLWSIARRGGTTIVQDPADARHPEMPLRALSRAPVQHCVPLDQIAPLLVQLASEGGKREPEAQPAAAPPELAGLACPACRGVLSQFQLGRLLQYRCHAGHRFSQESLVVAQEQEIERLLYGALSLTQERAALLRHVSERYFRDLPAELERYARRIAALDHRVRVLHELLEEPPT